MIGLFTFALGLLAATLPAFALPAQPRDNLPHSLPNPKAPHKFIATTETPVSYWVSTGASFYVPGDTVPPSSGTTSQPESTVTALATSLVQPAVAARASTSVPSRNVSALSPASQAVRLSLLRRDASLRGIPTASPMHELRQRGVLEGGDANVRGMRREVKATSTKQASGTEGGVRSSTRASHEHEGVVHIDPHGLLLTRKMVRVSPSTYSSVLGSQWLTSWGFFFAVAVSDEQDIALSHSVFFLTFVSKSYRYSPK